MSDFDNVYQFVAIIYRVNHSIVALPEPIEA